MYPIEEVARRTGRTKRTIRYYEEIGLLPPPERSTGGHRVYTEAHIEALDRIVLLHSTLGLSLVELKEFLSLRHDLETLGASVRGSPDSPEKTTGLVTIQGLLHRQLELLDAQRAKLERARNEAATLLHRVETRLKGLTPQP